MNIGTTKQQYNLIHTKLLFTFKLSRPTTMYGHTFHWNDDSLAQDGGTGATLKQDISQKYPFAVHTNQQHYSFRK